MPKTAFFFLWVGGETLTAVCLPLRPPQLCCSPWCGQTSPLSPVSWVWRCQAAPDLLPLGLALLLPDSLPWRGQVPGSRVTTKKASGAGGIQVSTWDVGRGTIQVDQPWPSCPTATSARPGLRCFWSPPPLLSHPLSWVSTPRLGRVGGRLWEGCPSELAEAVKRPPCAGGCRGIWGCRWSKKGFPLPLFPPELQLGGGWSTQRAVGQSCSNLAGTRTSVLAEEGMWRSALH